MQVVEIGSELDYKLWKIFLDKFDSKDIRAFEGVDFCKSRDVKEYDIKFLHKQDASYNKIFDDAEDYSRAFELTLKKFVKEMFVLEYDTTSYLINFSESNEKPYLPSSINEKRESNLKKYLKKIFFKESDKALHDDFIEIIDELPYPPYPSGDYVLYFIDEQNMLWIPLEGTKVYGIGSFMNNIMKHFIDVNGKIEIISGN